MQGLYARERVDGQGKGIARGGRASPMWGARADSVLGAVAREDGEEPDPPVGRIEGKEPGEL